MHIGNMRPKMGERYIVVMGSYVADLAFRTEKLPAWGETYMGTGFKLGPGGKGSNQAVAAARAGAKVSFISKLALAEEMDIGQAARFGCAVAGISVTRPGTTPSMPHSREVDELLK
jgi:ribokinase